MKRIAGAAIFLFLYLVPYHVHAITFSVNKWLVRADDGSFFSPGGTSDSLVLIHLDPFGNEIQRTEYTVNRSMAGLSLGLTMLSNGDLMMWGNDGSDIVLFRVKQDGTPVWIESLPAFRFLSLTATSDSGIVMSGEVALVSAWVMKLDANGAIQWQRNIGAYQSGSRIQGTPDGGYLYAGSGSEPDSNPRALLVTKLTSTGDVVWQKSYSGAPGVEWFRYVSVLADGSLSVASKLDDSSTLLLKMAQDGTLQWGRILQHPERITPSCEMGTSDGNLLLAAGIGDPSVGLAPSALLFDASGTLLWQKMYVAGGAALCSELPDHRFLFTNGISFILENDGSMTGTCLSDLTASVTPISISEQNLNLSNAPASFVTTALAITQSKPSRVQSTTSYCQCGNILLNQLYLPNAVLSQSYDVQLVTSGDQPPFVVTVEYGQLPPGLTLSPSGTLSGTPVERGSWQFTVKVTDPNGCFITRSFTLKVLPVCLYCVDFDHISGLPQNWVVQKGTWDVSFQRLHGSSSRKAEINSGFAFTGCSQCTFEALMEVEGTGVQSVFLPWHIDKKNTVEVRMMANKNRWIVKRRINGMVVASAKASMTIEAFHSYSVSISFDGANFHLTVDGTPLLDFPAGTGQPPLGAVGFSLKHGDAFFDELVVY